MFALAHTDTRVPPSLGVDFSDVAYGYEFSVRFWSSHRRKTASSVVFLSLLRLPWKEFLI